MAFEKIQEYIQTSKGSQGTLLIPKLIMPTLIAAANKALLPRELAAMVWGPNQIQGSSFSINLETPDSMTLPRNVGEGAEIVLDSLDYSSVTYTPVKYGICIRVTREMMEDSQFDLFQGNVAYAGKKFAELETNLVITALDGANTTITGGASITIADITSGMLAIENQDFVATDFIAGNEVLNDLRNIDTFVEADKSGNTEMLSRGFKGIIYGMNVAKFSTNAAPTTTYTKYGYIIDRSQAYGIAIKRDLTVENFDLPTFDMQGAAITMRLAVNLHRNKAVAKITTT